MKTALLYLGAVILVVGAAFPLFWMVSTSLKPSGEIFVTPPRMIPAHPTLQNFGRLFTETSFLTYFRNSVTVAPATPRPSVSTTRPDGST